MWQNRQYIITKLHGKGALSFSSTLIHIPCRLIEVSQHGHQTIAMSIGATDIGSTGADIGDGHPNATSLGYQWDSMKILGKGTLLR